MVWGGHSLRLRSGQALSAAVGVGFEVAAISCGTTARAGRSRLHDLVWGGDSPGTRAGQAVGRTRVSAPTAI